MVTKNTNKYKGVLYKVIKICACHFRRQQQGVDRFARRLGAVFAKSKKMHFQGA